ncbi:MAG: sulfatase, partial [Thermodesulfobacteriota bacterium]
AALPGGSSAFGGGDGPCTEGVARDDARPHVLLLSVDTLRADVARTMRSYQRIARMGLEFTSHVSPAPWTLPAMASLLTGRPPGRHGAGRSRSSRSVIAKTPLARGVSTIAGELGAHGYRTHAVVTNPFLTSSYGIDRGFCTFDNVSMRGEAVRGLSQSTVLRLARRIAPGLEPSDRADVVRREAERWIQAHAGRPFFLWVHFLDPHAPYGDRDGSSTSLAFDLVALQDRRGIGEPFSAMALLRSGEYRPGAAERRKIVELYRSDVAFVDEQISLLLDFLERHRLLARTAIVLTADHGEEFWDHGGVEHGHTLYDEVVRVPLVLYAPGREPLRRPRTDLTTAIDVAPTIAALTGTDPRAFAGDDLLASPPSAPARERAVRLGCLLFGDEWTGVRTAHAKYMRGEHGEERFYDLAADPGELVNRVATDPPALLALRRSADAAADRLASSARRGRRE